MSDVEACKPIKSRHFYAFKINNFHGQQFCSLIFLDDAGCADRGSTRVSGRTINSKYCFKDIHEIQCLLVLKIRLAAVISLHLSFKGSFVSIGGLVQKPMQ